MEEQKHEMVLERMHPSGAEEWYCPACGRCLLVSWLPKFMRIVVEGGDEYAIHSRRRAGLHVDPVQLGSSSDTALLDRNKTVIDESRLAPWIAWMEEVDFESLWDAKRSA